MVEHSTGTHRKLGQKLTSNFGTSRGSRHSQVYPLLRGRTRLLRCYPPKAKLSCPLLQEAVVPSLWGTKPREEFLQQSLQIGSKNNRAWGEAHCPLDAGLQENLKTKVYKLAELG